jgi:predicted phosphodiesterase
MRVAALYDVHGNLPALEAVLAELDGIDPDLTVFGGDVAAGGLPCETLDLLRSLERARFVRGNCERNMLDGVDHPLIAWPASRLDSSQRAFLASFEPTVVVDGVLYCHATPSSDEAQVTILTPDDLAAGLVGEPAQSTVVVGHTHSQFDRRLGAVRLVNAGSVGMPCEDEPGAYWVLLRDGEPEHRRTGYDLGRAAERIRAGGWPDAEGWIDRSLLNAPSPRDHAELLESRRAQTS